MCRNLVLACLLLSVGCSQTSPSTVAPSTAARASTALAVGVQHASPTVESGGGNLLLAYPPVSAARREGPYTWYPVEVSEADALGTLHRGGEMVVVSPDGTRIRLSYNSHIEHANGNWTWVGKGDDGTEAVLTFGDRAVFGNIPIGHGAELRLATRNGRNWLVSTDKGAAGSPEGRESDYIVPPSLASELADDHATVSQQQLVGEAAAAESLPTVDVVLGYTTGFATYVGGDSQAVTRLQNLVDVSNRALANSQVNALLRLVKTISVNYPDASDNGDALEALTGYKSGVGFVPPDQAFTALRSARDQYGADLVSLVRRFRTPENDGCGIAWLIGGGQSGVDTSDAPFAYSVVSDGSDYDETDAKTYYCRDETLAHELGHNMGQAHNQEDSTSTGAHAYSYGYREAASTGFYTIMAYRASGQYSIRYFANPGVVDVASGRPTGTAAANNALSMAQTIPVVTRFRAEVMSFIDVPPQHWAFSYIERLFSAGVSTGCSLNPRRYCPDDPVRRDEMAVFLLRAKHGGAYAPPAAAGIFADVPSSYWAASWIERIYAEGVTSGCQNSPLMYCPSTPVTRDQMAVFLLRAKYGVGYVPPAATGVFADVPVSHWAAPWIERLASEGITAGCSVSPKLYCPSSGVTRDQMAVFISRTFGL
jgi:hypothetical protein